ncbi:MAG: hypothetical protein M1536_01350 [Firmicutes bacterium]|nr:hypothetical protein [Bacillota bacterium]
MNLPDNVSQTELFNRIKSIYTEVTQNNVHIPENVTGYIREIIKCLTGNRLDLEQLSSYANGILYWYYDQGFREVPMHVALSRFALDIVKMCDITKTLSQVESLLFRTKAPADLREIAGILKNLLAIFAPDGRMDEERYSKLVPQLRDLCVSNEEILKKSVDHAIFYI